MKRILLIMVMLLTVVGAKAQVTFNARVGGGVMTDYPGIVGLIQANIPFKKGGRFTFSPSLEYNHSFDSNGDDAYASKLLLGSLNFGIKASLGNKALLIPKVGVAVGNEFGDYDRTFVVGPSTELAFEYKHFTVALGGFYSIDETSSFSYDTWYIYRTPWKATISLGYKF